MRYRCIHRRRSQYPVAMMCRLLKVSKGGYYAWRVRLKEGRGAILALVVLIPMATQAHVTIAPRESTQGATVRYTVRIPTEGDVATIGAELDRLHDLTRTSSQLASRGLPRLRPRARRVQHQ